jgi:exodeoxyribonuclease VII large subunit
VELAGQRFNIAANRLSAGLEKNASAHERDLVRISSRLSPLLLQRPQRVQAEQLGRVAVRLRPCIDRSLARIGERLASLGKLYDAVNPNLPLHRGFARVHRADGALVRSAAAPDAGEAVSLVFHDGARSAVVDGASDSEGQAAASIQRRPRTGPKAAVKPVAQGDLF